MADLFPPVLNEVAEIFDAILPDGDWRERYREGSFRGVPFYTKSHKFQSGRRKATHEFPEKEVGNSEDLGKKLPTFSLDLYVLGDSYFEQRDALIKALDTKGAGELIHPYLGTKQVQVGGYSLSETNEEGGMARFSVEFDLAGKKKFPAEEQDAVQSVLDGILNVINAANAAFSAAFSIANTPARVAQSAAKLVKKATGAVDRVARKVGKTADAVNDVAYALKNIEADVEQLLNTPSVLAERFNAAFDLLFNTTDDLKDLARRLSEETNNIEYEPVVGAETPTVTRLKGNQNAFSDFIINVSLANSMKAAIQASYVSNEEAIELRDTLNRDIEKQLPLIDDDESYQNMKDSQVALNRGLPPQSTGQIISFTPPVTLPALVISNRLFGNIEKENEIIEHNKVEHPGFVQGGFEIEVTSA